MSISWEPESADDIQNFGEDFHPLHAVSIMRNHDASAVNTELRPCAWGPEGSVP